MNAVPYLALSVFLLSASCMEKPVAIAFGNGSFLVFPRQGQGFGLQIELGEGGRIATARPVRAGFLTARK